MQYDSMESQSRLRSYNGKSMFHGSPNFDIEKLDPRLATDVDSSNAFNNDTAVFATRNPTEAIIFAVMNMGNIPKDLVEGKRWGSTNIGDEVTARIPKEWKSYIEKNVGLVYVLPMESFTEFEGTHGKSKVSVEPEERVPVMFQDYLAFGGKVEWK